VARRFAGRQQPSDSRDVSVARTSDFDEVYTSVYTPPMSERAKLFQNGGSQAVRLPKSCRFSDDQDEVIVRRVGKQVILEPADEWSAEFLACLGSWKEDIPRPPARNIGGKRDPFDRS